MFSKPTDLMRHPVLMLSTHYAIALANTAVLADRFTKMCNVFLCLKKQKTKRKQKRGVPLK